MRLLNEKKLVVKKNLKKEKKNDNINFRYKNSSDNFYIINNFIGKK